MYQLKFAAYCGMGFPTFRPDRRPVVATLSANTKGKATMFIVFDSKTREYLGNLPTPWLIEEGGGRAWRDPAYHRMWSAVEYPGATIPEDAEIRDVSISQSLIDWDLEADCQCRRDYEGEIEDHPLLRVQCTEDREHKCSASDCICTVKLTDQCPHCGAKAILILA